jgi:hypothetical protein
MMLAAVGSPATNMHRAHWSSLITLLIEKTWCCCSQESTPAVATAHGAQCGHELTQWWPTRLLWMAAPIASPHPVTAVTTDHKSTYLPALWLGSKHLSTNAPKHTLSHITVITVIMHYFMALS